MTDAAFDHEMQKIAGLAQYFTMACILTACSGPVDSVRGLKSLVEGETVYCQGVCWGDGIGVTASHCRASDDGSSPLVIFPVPNCEKKVAVRKAPLVKGEMLTCYATINGGEWQHIDTTVYEPRWLQWVILDDPGVKSQSGCGFYDAAGEFAAIAHRNHDGMLYAVAIDAVEENARMEE